MATGLTHDQIIQLGLDENNLPSQYYRSDAGGSSGSSGLLSVDDYIKAITDTLPSPPPEYLKANPFYFDEQSAKQASEAEFSPYYKEIMSDYMTDVNKTKERAGTDTTSLLNELDRQKTSFLRDEGTNLDRTIRGIKEGYSSSGLYFSGANNRTQNETTTDSTNRTADYLGNYDYKAGQANTALNRQLSDLTLGQTRENRDVGRQMDTAITGGVAQRKTEAYNQYLSGMGSYYSTPNWSSVV